MSAEQAAQILELVASLRDDLLAFVSVMIACTGMYFGYCIIGDILDVLWRVK